MAKKKKKGAENALNKAGRKPSLVHTEILIRPMHRGVSDIASWRSALRLADAGNRCKLYDLYSDLLIDGYLSDAIGKRIDAVTDAELSFTVNGERVEVIDSLMDTPEFEEQLCEIMLSRFWGVTLDEYDFREGFSFTSIPRKHIRCSLKEIALREEDARGVPYAGNPNIIQYGGDDDYGILLRAAPFVIYKRGGFGDWAQFVEIFGMPQRIGKYSSMDEQSRRALIQAFEEAGSAPYLVIPKETEATQTELSSSGNGALYDDFRRACNEEILITVLGQTMTTQDGSSLSQSQVHMEVQEKKHRADRRFVERMLNKHLVPLLESRGYPVAGGKFKFLDKAQEITVDETVSLSRILPIPRTYLYDKYNIPRPEEGEEVAGEQPPAASDIPPAGLEEPETDIKNDDRRWYRRWLDFFVGAPIYGASNGKVPIRLNERGTLEERLIGRVAESDGYLRFDYELFDFFREDFIRALAKGRNRKKELADFVYGAQDDAFITAMEMNLFLFSAAKTLAEVTQLNRLFQESGSFDEFHKKALQTTDVFNKTWQRTEYETAVLTAESASNYHRLVEKTKLFPYWEYKTVGDSRVREEHQRLDGLILATSDPRWDKIFPPNGWKCRCYVVPRMAHHVAGVDLRAMQQRCDEYLQSDEWKLVEAQHWDVNRGKRSEVFDKDQMYIRKFPDVAAKLMDRVPLSLWGVNPSLKKRIAESDVSMPVYEGGATSWWKERAVVADGREVIAVTDYNGRQWIMNRRDYDAHTSNARKKREFRTSYLACLDELMGDPDELWLGREYKDRDGKEMELTNYIWIKYYKGRAVACASKIENGRLTLKSWFDVRDPKIRKGLLLKAR